MNKLRLAYSRLRDYVEHRTANSTHHLACQPPATIQDLPDAKQQLITDIRKSKKWDFPGSPVAKTVLPLKGAQV